jgi:hypothetical protein
LKVRHLHIEPGNPEIIDRDKEGESAEFFECGGFSPVKG